MATGKLLRQLIKSGMEGNIEAFRAASEEVIKEERQKQHHLLGELIGSGVFFQAKSFGQSHPRRNRPGAGGALRV